MNHYHLIDNYIKYLDSFSEISPQEFDLNKTEISEIIFVHIFKLKAALWKQSVNFNRKKRISISDIFQDVIAMYIRLALDSSFEVILEEKKGKFQPDILIKYNEKNLFIIEIKTTIGWERNSLDGYFQQRISEMSKIFEIEENNIVYIFQSPWNVNKDFLSKYLDTKTYTPKPLPTEFPYNKIRPLMMGEDPYYFKAFELDRKTKYQEFTEMQIIEKASSNIAIPLELTIKEIIKATKNE
jgi:hypothetical protein